MAGKGILLGADGDIEVSNGQMIVGDSEMQETAIILGLNQGEQKLVPVLGPNLVQLVKTNASRFEIEQRVRVHLAKDGKDYAAIKHKIQTTIR